ncbi:response regulator transcription factor [Sulfoacidibacillus thermotolerans]|uniref:DNA-binding response regulator n=1 Tax=Sulfoacidibacillus thermotolerans TaxID=1765684 RepID=A0A2U3DBB1_SULT2|nr:response regulator transcription factor [Sulfoacidibacillus thermotolerans]PWI58567.1 DNA-binding response regulator [Sulfoacidibacillus thermotolerans]
MIKIMLAEDQTLVRGALSALLQLEEDMNVVAEAGDGQNAIALALKTQPDIALIDLELPLLSGLEVVKQLAIQLPTCKTLVVTTFARPGYFKRALEAGASGYLLKDAHIEELTTAIRTVYQGGKILTKELLLQAMREENPLTQRELEILLAARRGLTTKEIAQTLFLSSGTVRNYLSEIMSKLQVQTRQDAIRHAEEKGWL